MRLPIYFSLLMSLFLFGCGTSQSGVNKGQANIYTVEDDIRIGAELDQQVQKEMKILHDQAIENYVSSLANQLYAVYPEKFLPGIRTRVVISDQVNAFALPGGYLYVNTGLINTVGNEAELAGVIAHEIGHAIARHGTERLTQATGVQVAAVIVGSAAGGIYGKAVGLFGTVGLLHYGRKAELEADRLGMKDMYNANYDLHAMETMFQKLAAVQKREPGKMEQWVSTHPPISERIEQVRQGIAEFPAQSSPRLNSQSFTNIKSRASAYK